MKKSSIAALTIALCFLSPLAACANDPKTTESAPDLSIPEESAPDDAFPDTSVPEENTPVQPPATLPETPVVAKAQYARCTGSSVHFRAGAGTEFSVVGSAKQGETYAVVGKTGNWYKTFYRGKTAYISASYVSLFSLEKTENGAEKAIDEGYKLLGVPYVYGAIRFHDGNGKLLAGFTAQKFDCSSLVQYVFYQGTGVKIGVTTRVQVTQGKYVHPDDLQRGDCIYFTNEARQHKTGIERVGHVAVYLGDGYILHTASDYARIEKMSKQRWDFYIEARRFV